MHKNRYQYECWHTNIPYNGYLLVGESTHKTTAKLNQNAWQCPAWWPPVEWVETPVLFFAVFRPKFTKLSVHEREWPQFATPFSVWWHLVAFWIHSPSSREVVSNRGEISMFRVAKVLGKIEFYKFGSSSNMWQSSVMIDRAIFDIRWRKKI